jgi:hypothetical protein
MDEEGAAAATEAAVGAEEASEVAATSFSVATAVGPSAIALM